MATVQGRKHYVVSVWLVRGRRHDGPLQSTCTCPVGYDGCKHAVAVVAEYLGALAEERSVPRADPDDPRWARLQDDEDGLETEDLDDEWGADEDWEVEDGEEEHRPAARPGKKAAKTAKPKTPRRTRAQWDEKIRQFIRAKDREELAELVCSFVERFAELREELKERIALGEGDVDRLVTQARHELRELTAEIGWQNRWQGEGHTPDYSRLRHRLERLLELGHADAVVELGRDLLPRAMAQVAESHDEGETAMAVSECMPVLFDAVMKSALSGPEKILFAIDACLKDDYDVVGDAAGKVLDAKWSRDDWSAVADQLQGRLQQMAAKADDPWSHNYRRERIGDWLLDALENAGRGDELLNVLETEARATNSYQRLVEHLIQQRQYDDAERWAREGIERTCQKLPGIASALAGLLCELARRRRRWDVVAAHAACQFFSTPGKSTFAELVTQAAKAKCEEQVRAAALQFLETGKPPIQCATAGKTKKGKAAKRAIRVDPAWPLPLPDYLVPLFEQNQARHALAGPHYNVLLDMAIAARKPDEVLHWYDRMQTGRGRSAGPWGGYWHGDAERVAAAVVKSHPQRALEIYQQQLEGHLPHANMSAYQAAADCLRKMRPILKSLGREVEWSALLTEIRNKYGNRPRFMEILDRLTGRTILEEGKSRRKRR